MPRRGERDAGGSSLSLRGLSSLTTLAAFAMRKRPSVGRYFQRQRVSPAPDGASCENHPRIRPYFVVAPSGAAFWACYRAPTTALQPPLPRRGACARKVPTWRLYCRCSATGVPLRGDRVAVGYPRYRSALLGAAALALCFAFPNGFSVGTGATRSAKQHPSGRLRRCPSGSAYSQNRGAEKCRD